LARKGDTALQRLFSTFPGGPPGFGLLLLRITVGLAGLAVGSSYLFSPSAGLAVKCSLGLLMAVTGAAITVGFLTPIAGALAALCFLSFALRWFVAPVSTIHDIELIAFVLTSTATAVVLLGPGAFSLDGYLFGRREIIISPSSSRDPEA
jgi:hypothetical protein